MPKQNENSKSKSEEMPDIWEDLAREGQTIERYQVKENNLSSGDHYWKVVNARQGGVICLSCPVIHGGIIDAHELYRTRVYEGVIYLDERAITTKPAGFVPTSN